eukprot:COSAG06_NODE_3811_length_4884_cov_11.896134_3_plen_72_part_00
MTSAALYYRALLYIAYYRYATSLQYSNDALLANAWTAVHARDWPKLPLNTYVFFTRCCICFYTYVCCMLLR